MADAASGATVQTLAVKRSALRVIVLAVISLGLYNLYWFYITRAYLDKELGNERSLPQLGPALQTFGPLGLGLVAIPLMFILIGFALLLLVIIFSIVVWYYLIKDISRVRVKNGLSEISPGLYILGYIVLNMAFGAGVAILGLMQANLNEFWDKRTGGSATEARYGAGEIVVSVTGLILLVLLVVFIVIVSVIAGIQDSRESRDLKGTKYEYPSGGYR